MINEVEIYCDNCKCLCSDKEGVKYVSQWHSFEHLCSSCRKKFIKEDKKKSRERNRANKKAEEDGNREWGRLRGKVYR